jgi:hypothetical protein
MAVLRRQARIDARVAVIVFLARMAQGNGGLAGIGPGRGEQRVEDPLGLGCGRRDEKQDEERQEKEAALRRQWWCWTCHWPVWGG